LLLHLFKAVAVAAKLAAGAAPTTVPHVGRMGVRLAGDAGLAILTLLMITLLSIDKPWGVTPDGRQKSTPAA